MATAAKPLITPGDRFGLTICFAIVFHAVFILGIGFVPEELAKRRFDTMEIVLVQSHSEAPDDADYLAQASLEGSGDTKSAERPSAPFNAPVPDLRPDVAAPPVPAADPVPREQQVSEAAPAPETTLPEPGVSTPEQETIEHLVTESKTGDQALPQPKPQPTPSPSETGRAQQTRNAKSRATPSAAQLVASSFAIASLNAEVRRRLEARSKRPRRKFISASTREYKFAAYMESWRAKVERIGNLNYPSEARRAKLSGSLILEVVVNPDGTVKEMMVRRSSGHKLLDDAAIQIVQQAAPFAPFPDQIREDVDLLHITRTWQFLNSQSFSSKK